MPDTFKTYLRESLLGYFDGDASTQKYRVYKNPTIDEYKELNNQSEDGLRGVLIDEDIFVWISIYDLQQAVVRKMDLGEPGFIGVDIIMDKEATKFLIKLSGAWAGHEKSDLDELVKAHPQIRKLPNVTFPADMGI